ncbi:Gfo/Idh/MocA family protein [Microvirga aerophila]|uniref:NADH-dependent dehydrogenase n=1 Tax=Microvirga aerophila TaxID=670291 RepID=A0A512BWA2_9HYPH|nr:Gfo/Idh/MocA family oxidoreductase [Microvirga aerophila]GEO16127.1 NADH-dependent dehydrogenase [Microvirga aerophila]
MTIPQKEQSRTAEKVLRVGMAGCGWVSEHHLRAWSNLAGRAKVMCLADPVKEKAAARAAQFNVPRCFGSLEEMLDSGEIDVLDVATPRETHAAAVRAAAVRGIPVLCQKPFAPNLAEAEAVLEEIRGRTRLMIHENWRFRPYIRQMRAWIDQGLVGQVTQCQFNLLNSGFVPDAEGKLPAVLRQPFFADVPRMLMMEILIHHVDALRYLFGPLELLGAWLGKSTAGIRGDDSAAVLMRTQSDAQAAIVMQATMTAVGLPTRSPDHFQIFGTAGTIVFKDGLLRLLGPHSREITFDLDEAYRSSYRDAIAHFVDRLADGKEFETNAEDNLETLRLVEGIYANGLCEFQS